MSTDEDAPGKCPVCRSEDNYRVPSFTWWGGMIGHRMISHVFCNECNSGFNVKTGKPNTMNIILYQVGVFVLLVPLLLCWLGIMFNL